MTISRRKLLIAGTAAPWPLFARAAEDGTPFALELPVLQLDARLPTYAAVDTSGFTNCQVQVLNLENRVMQESRDWGTEPNHAEGAQLSGKLAGEGLVGCHIQVMMRPTRKQTPSVAIALKQGEREGVARLEPAAFHGTVSNDAQEIERLKKMALLARFVKDPAQSPGGQFEVDLPIDSSISVRIWAGEKAIGRPLYQKQFLDRPNGQNPIPWDLKTLKGALVPAGRYVAFLLCVPTERRIQPTALASYFAVVSG